MLNKEERKIELKKCEQILSENLGQIPLYKVNSVVCYKENLSGFYVNKNGNIDLEEIKRVR